MHVVSRGKARAEGQRVGQGCYTVRGESRAPPQPCHSLPFVGRLAWALLQKEAVSRVNVMSVSI